MISKELEEKLRKEFAIGMELPPTTVIIKDSNGEEVTLNDIADFWIGYIQGTLEEERSRLVKGVEGMKKEYYPKTPTESSGGKCGFPNDHRQCFCQHNSTLSDVQKLINEGK